MRRRGRQEKTDEMACGPLRPRTKSGEDRGQEAAVHEEVGGVADEGIEEESHSGEADGGEVQALTRGEGEGVLEFSKSEPARKVQT